MKTFKDWVMAEKGVNLDEVATDSAQAQFARPVGGMVRRGSKKMDQEPLLVGNDLKPKKGKKGKNNKGVKAPKVKDMTKDFDDL